MTKQELREQAREQAIEEIIQKHGIWFNGFKLIAFEELAYMCSFDKYSGLFKIGSLGRKVLKETLNNSQEYKLEKGENGVEYIIKRTLK